MHASRSLFGAVGRKIVTKHVKGSEITATFFVRLEKHTNNNNKLKSLRPHVHTFSSQLHQHKRRNVKKEWHICPILCIHVTWVKQWKICLRLLVLQNRHTHTQKAFPSYYIIMNLIGTITEKNTLLSLSEKYITAKW